MEPKPTTTIVYIYGPPAVGKTTVATALSRATGYPLLHTHLFTPIASTLMRGDMRTNRAFRKLLTNLRMVSLRAALRAKSPGVIITGVYVYKTRKNRFIEMLQRLPARIAFVRLTASERSLLRRVTGASRRRFDSHKITTREKLLNRMTSENVTSPIPGLRSFTIDTDELKPVAAAMAVVSKFKLRV